MEEEADVERWLMDNLLTYSLGIAIGQAKLKGQLHIAYTLAE